MPKNHINTIAEDLSEVKERLGWCNFFMKEAVSKLEDGNTEWDKSVQHLKSMVEEATMQLERIEVDLARNSE